jgi:RND family efflux transporter MFP subunit
MRKRWWVAGAVGVLAGVAAVAWVARGKTGALPVGPAQAKAPMAASAASAPVTLEFSPQEVVQPTMATLARRIEFSGPLVAPDTAVVRAKVAGVLNELPIAEGTEVRAGQLLGRIEQPDLASRLAEREAALAAARVALQQAEKTHASNERLAAQNFISGNALEVSKTAVDNARAQADQARAALDITRVAQRESAIVAPMAGIVARRHVVPGEKVTAEQQVATLVNLARLELAGSVGTHEVPALRPGLPVVVRVEGLAQPVQGTLARIAPAAEPGTRSIGVAVTLPNAGRSLRAGQYAVASVELADAQPRLTLPESALAGSMGQQHVWVIENGKLQRRGVTTGVRDEAGHRVELLSGVARGATVLAARFDNLKDGAPAKVAAGAAGVAPAPATASAAASAPVVR